MCGPVAIPLALAVVSAGVGLYQANQNKHAVEAQLKQQQKQVDQNASAQMEDRIKAAREARASARAAAAESGVGGNSADAVLSDIQFQASRDVSRIEKNRENGIDAAGEQANARYSEINGQLAASLVQSASVAATSAGAKQKP
ncbi:hypothetical protein ISN75_14150 [Dyella marensis]|uniref:virion core protein, T7 gp14 family n=1 Tax=Dyella marensis TaxID=500610 RepID=UPI0031D28FFC